MKNVNKETRSAVFCAGCHTGYVLGGGTSTRGLTPAYPGNMARGFLPRSRQICHGAAAMQSICRRLLGMERERIIL
ncbi:MAG: hypothetical protein PHQ44_02060 [Anaerovibrio sp.]|nr:hypothetical protein [Anaerovibrio sp.]